MKELRLSPFQADEELVNLKGKLRALEHQFDQMKEEMVAKEAAVQRERSEKNELESVREDLENRLEKERKNYE